MSKKLFFNPLFIFWAYYFVGPFLTIPEILSIVNNEFIFNEDDLLNKLLFHVMAYASIFPFVLFISSLKFDRDYSKRKKVGIGFRTVVSILLILFISYLFYFLISNFQLIVGSDYPRAVAYIQFLEANRIITILLFLFILIYLFLDNKYINIFGAFILIFDFLMSRRSLMIFFFQPWLRKITYKTLVILFIFFSAFSLLRHRQNLGLNGYSLFGPLFSESYMVFLSSVQFEGCPSYVNTFNGYLNFERTFADTCRTLNSGAGGFSSRFHFDILFGLFSVGCFTLISSILLIFFRRYILRRLQPIIAIILFVTLFIIFRDSLWNAQLFFFKYFLVLIGASLSYSFIKRVRINYI